MIRPEPVPGDRVEICELGGDRWHAGTVVRIERYSDTSFGDEPDSVYLHVRITDFPDPFSRRLDSDKWRWPETSP